LQVWPGLNDGDEALRDMEGIIWNHLKGGTSSIFDQVVFNRLPKKFENGVSQCL